MSISKKQYTTSIYPNIYNYSNNVGNKSFGVDVPPPPPRPLATLIEQSPSPPQQKILQKSTSGKDFFDNNRNSEALRLSRISEEVLFPKGSADDNIRGLESAALSYPNKPKESFVPPPPPPLANEAPSEEVVSIDERERDTATALKNLGNQIALLKQKRVDDAFNKFKDIYKPEHDKKEREHLGESKTKDFNLYGSRELDKIAFEKYKKDNKGGLHEHEWKELEQKLLGYKSATEIEFEKMNESMIGLTTKAYTINVVGVVLGGFSSVAVIPVIPYLAPVLAGSVVILVFCKTLAEKYKSKLSLRNLVNDLSNICLRIYQTIDNINKSISDEDEKTKQAFNDEATLKDLDNSLIDVYVYIMSLLDEPELQIMSSSYKKKGDLTGTESFILKLIDEEIQIQRTGSLQMNRVKRAIGFRILNSSEFTLRLTSLMTKLNSNLILYYNNFLAKGIMDNKVIIKFNELQDITSQANKTKQEKNSPINLMTSAINITPDMVKDFRAKRGEWMDTITVAISNIAKSMFEGYSKYGVDPFKHSVQSIKSTFKRGGGGHKHRITKKQRQKGKKTYKRKPKKFKRTLRK
jgi:hypothetical protein